MKSLLIGIKNTSIRIIYDIYCNFGMIYFTHIQRLHSIEHQLDTQHIKHVVVLEKLPFENMLNKVTPSDDIQHNLFKIYYDIPQNIKLKLYRMVRTWQNLKEIKYEIDSNTL